MPRWTKRQCSHTLRMLPRTFIAEVEQLEERERGVCDARERDGEREVGTRDNRGTSTTQTHHPHKPKEVIEET